MTSQKDQIQALIADIDGVLQKTTPRLPWVVSGEMTHQRQVLERVRNYLVAFQRRQMAGEEVEQARARPDLLAHDIYYQAPPDSYQAPQMGSPLDRSQAYGQEEATAQQMLQMVVQEMGYLRSSLMQPLQSDLDGLRQQRELLVQEIRQLEAQRQSYAGQVPMNQQQMIAEFLQALMSRLQETLPQQVAQSLSGTSSQQALPYATNTGAMGLEPQLAGTSYQNMGALQAAPAQADELLIKLDSTLSVVFESLQRNVQAYQESLSQGLDKMHNMGQQGEMMFAALINHLAQQLGREASSYLQSSATPAGLESVRSPGNVAGTGVQPTNAVNPTLLTQPNPSTSATNLALPFPGTEISSGFTDAASVPSVDTAIDAWLRSAGSGEAPPDVDLEIAALNLDGFDLSQLEAQDVNALLELDANLLSTDLPPQPLLSPTDPAAVPAPVPPPTDASLVRPVIEEDTADIDAALKLLEQLSSELQDQPSPVAAADAQIDRMLTSPLLETDAANSTRSVPSDEHDDLDEFYESLFGANAIAAESTTAPEPPTATTTFTPTNPIAENPIAKSIATTQSEPLADQAAVAQPISTLPAETPIAGSTVLEPALPAVAQPIDLAVNDPTLGWDLLEKPPAGQGLVAEPEIPTALLEDELMGGWDFSDAETIAGEPVVVDSTSIDSLSGWDTAIAPNQPPVDASVSSAVSLLGLFDDNTPAGTTTSPLETDVPFVSEQASQPAGATDTIGSLADLFGDGDAVDVPPQTAAIVNPTDASLAQPTQAAPQYPVAPTTTSLPPTTLSTNDSRQLASSDLTDDRYTPASPEENLLPLKEPLEEAEPELWLDENTLNRLSEDLFSFEDTTTDLPDIPGDLDDGTEASAFSSAPAAIDAASIDREPPSLEDWSDASLDDFAAALPTPELGSFPLETQSDSTPTDPPNLFTLEGMDDLFANAPINPPVSPAPPPVPPAAIDPASAFTLEGMDDLFADMSATLPATPAPNLVLPPAAEPGAGNPVNAFTLEGMDDLFAESLDTPAQSSSTEESLSAFTLEGIDITDPAIPVSTPPPTESIATADEPLPLTLTADEPLPFTLDGMDTLFTDVPSVNAVPDPTTVTATPTAPPNVVGPVEPQPAFTLSQSDLFTDAPSALPVSNAPALDDHSVTAPATLEPLEERSPAPFTLEQVGSLFVEMPSATSSQDTASVPDTQVATDAPPIAPAATTEPSLSDMPNRFTLEQFGELFVEVPSEAATASDELTPQQTQQLVTQEETKAPPEETISSKLDQAFASLMGPTDLFDTDLFNLGSDPIDPSASSEKKKG